MRIRYQLLDRTWLFLMRVTLFICLFFEFFWTFSIRYPWILRISRTAAVTMVTFTVSIFAFQSIYGGYNVGKQRSKTIINNMILTVGLTDCITYVQLSIMNTNARFNAVFKPANFWLLIASVLLQWFTLVIFTYIGNEIFFTINPPEKTLIITTSQYSLNKIVPKVKHYGKQFQIVGVMDYATIKVYERILECDTIFLYDIPVGERARLIEYCYDNHKNIYYNLELCDVVSLGAQHILLQDKSLICATVREMSLEQRFIKRTMDIVVSIAALVIASPIMIGCAIAIKLGDHGPVFFKQERATRNGKVFQVYKFRTMTVHDPNAPQVSAKANDQRITPVGKYLRKFRIDELPQLINILKGEMSLVGPRPEMMENVYSYTKELPEFEYRLRVKAGLTGMAQVYGKYNTSPKDKLILDLIYIQKYRLLMDIKLILQTLLIFLKSSDSTEGFSEEQTIIEFKRYDN